jgi:hypothetical protein
MTNIHRPWSAGKVQAKCAAQLLSFALAMSKLINGILSCGVGFGCGMYAFYDLRQMLEARGRTSLLIFNPKPRPVEPATLLVSPTIQSRHAPGTCGKADT